MAAALAVALVCSGCYRIRYITRLPPEPQSSDLLWHHTFIYGLIEGSAPVDVLRTCPEGFAVVENYESAANFIVSTSFDGMASVAIWATTGVPVIFSPWSPLTVEITCASR
jgi:hypothetical protein